MRSTTGWRSAAIRADHPRSRRFRGSRPGHQQLLEVLGDDRLALGLDGPPRVASTLAMLTQYTTSGIATFIQHAGVAAVREGEPFVAFMRGYCETGMAIVCDAAGELRPRPPGSAAHRWNVRLLRSRRHARFAPGLPDILEHTRVGLAPGAFFGPGSEGFSRLRLPLSGRSARGDGQVGEACSGKARRTRAFLRPPPRAQRRGEVARALPCAGTEGASAAPKKQSNLSLCPA